MNERNDRSRFDAMSTPELEEFLRLDFLRDPEEEEEADVEDILYVTDLLVRREAEDPNIPPAPVPSWEDFLRSLEDLDPEEIIKRNGSLFD